MEAMVEQGGVQRTVKADPEGFERVTRGVAQYPVSRIYPPSFVVHHAVALDGAVSQGGAPSIAEVLVDDQAETVGRSGSRSRLRGAP